MQPHWVGDLTLSATLEVKAARGVGPVRADRRRASPTAARSTWRRARPRSATATRSLGEQVRRDRRAGHVRRRLRQRRRPPDAAWSTAGRSSATGWPTTTARAPGRSRPRPTSRRPRSPRAGAAIEVSDLVLKRDIYYTQNPGRSDYSARLGRARTRGPRSSCSTSWPTRRSSRPRAASGRRTTRSGRTAS